MDNSNPATSTAQSSALDKEKRRGAMVLADHIKHPNPLSTTLGWELKRVYINRPEWLFAGLLLILFMLLTASQQRAHDLTFGWGTVTNGNYDPSNMIHVTITGTSGWGMIQTLPKLLLLVFGLFIPFLTADLVVRDLKRCAHGVIMSTTVPTWAYVWGRYLSGLLVSVAAATLMLPAILGVSVLFPVSTSEPSVNIGVIVAIWAVAVLPATILVSGVSFGLATLLPKYSSFVKIAVLTGWFLSSLGMLFVTDPGASGSSNYITWDPTATVMSLNVEAIYNERFVDALNLQSVSQPLTLAVRERAVTVAQEVEGVMPDLWPWVLPRLMYAGLGLLMVELAAIRFQRFRNV